jgi:hypothetical protein
MLTCESYDVCKERRKGLNEQIAGLDVKILAEQEGFVIDKARPIADSMLTANPDANVFIAENEDGIIAAAQAIKARGKRSRLRATCHRQPSRSHPLPRSAQRRLSGRQLEDLCMARQPDVYARANQ